MQQLTCVLCGLEWQRKPTRGNLPRLCVDCRVKARRNRSRTYSRPCAWCGKLGARSGGYCSKACAGLGRRRAPSCPVPATHPSRTVLVECDRCGAEFRTAQPHARLCSARCRARDKYLRRRVHEAGSSGTWRWSDFMRIAARFDYQCAYCDVKPDRLDPDHVVALGVGGSNTTTNLLPACPECNADKRHLSLQAWAAERARLGKPTVRTSWDAEDSRFWHLTESALLTAA